MEARVMKMESELRVLRAAITQVPQNILRELTARGALLMVQAPAAELEDVVIKGVEGGALEDGDGPIVVEEEVGEEEQEEEEVEEEDRTAGGDDDEETTATAEVDEDMEVEEDEKNEEEEEKAWGCDGVDAAADNHVVNAMAMEKEESSESEEDDSDDSSSSEEEEDGDEPAAQPVQVDQREDVETSQESTASGPVAEPVVQTPLSLSAFDKAIVQPTPAPMAATVPSRPPVPFTLQSVASAPIRPLVLARRPATTEASELALPPSATPTPVPAFMPTPARTQAVILDLPAHFEVQTKDSVPVAWEKWCCGDAYNGFPPLRLVTSKHVANKAVLRRLSDLRCAMLPIETLAKQNKLWSESLTPREALSVFQQLAPMLPLSQALPSGRERKKEITWSTALNIMRRGKKRKQPPQTNDGYISETLI